MSCEHVWNESATHLYCVTCARRRALPKPLRPGWNCASCGRFHEKTAARCTCGPQPAPEPTPAREEAALQRLKDMGPVESGVMATLEPPAKAEVSIEEDWQGDLWLRVKHRTLIVTPAEARALTAQLLALFPDMKEKV